MGISRDKWHKKRETGGKRAPIRMKRRFELGRQPAMTKLGERRVHRFRCRGGFIKYRALKLDHGSFAWSGEAITRKCRILDVVYNPTNKEFVRTNTIVKGSVVQVDATPFKNWYQKHYGVTVGKATAFVKDRKLKKLKTRAQKEEAARKAKKDAKRKAKVEARRAALAKSQKKGKDSKKKVVKGAEKKMKTSTKKDAKKPAVDSKKGAKKAEKTEVKVEKKEKVEKEKVKKEKVAKPKAEGAADAAVKKVVKKVSKKKKPTIKESGKTRKNSKALKKSQKHHPSGAQVKRWKLRNATRVLESGISDQFEKGRLFAKVATSPGQTGTADGYILEGEELAFYVKRMAHKKKK
jgi:small subunit ribosomal protein S8e